MLTYLARAAEKLRADGVAAQQLQLFISSNVFREDHDQYLGGTVIGLPAPSNDTLELAAATALRGCYREGIRYKKAGVLLRGLVSTPLTQGALFDDPRHRRLREQLNETVDTLRVLSRSHGRTLVKTVDELRDRLRCRASWARRPTLHADFVGNRRN